MNRKRTGLSLIAIVFGSFHLLFAPSLLAQRENNRADPLSNRSPAQQQRDKQALSKRKVKVTQSPQTPPPPQQGIAGLPANDNCENAIEVFEGDTPFSTIGATTDGLHHPECKSFGDDNVNQDIWFTFTATQTNALSIKLCGSDYDTRLALYDGCGVCPPSALISCNDDSCGLQSQIIAVATTIGQCLTIRVGGFDIYSGTGSLVVTYEVVRPCSNPDHHCCTTGGPGCSEPPCCEAVCSQDAFCCDAQWDSMCVSLADQLCGKEPGEYCPSPCSKDNPQSCFEPGKLPGCNSVFCCKDICGFDPFCCNVAWDEICVSQASYFCDFPCQAPCPPGAVLETETCGTDTNGGCNSLAVCTGPIPDCCAASPTGKPGCSDPACQSSICAADPFCCDTQWDSLCAAAACDDDNCQCEPADFPYQLLSCGESVCGTYWSSPAIRDTDWYSFNVTECGVTVTWEVFARFPPSVFILSGDCPPTPIGSAIGGCPAIASAQLVAGTYTLFVAPAFFVDLPCGAKHNDYVGTLTCEIPCTSDISSVGGSGPDGVVDVNDLLKVINSWGACK